MAPCVGGAGAGGRTSTAAASPRTMVALPELSSSSGAGRRRGAGGGRDGNGNGRGRQHGQAQQRRRCPGMRRLRPVLDDDRLPPRQAGRSPRRRRAALPAPRLRLRDRSRRGRARLRRRRRLRLLLLPDDHRRLGGLFHELADHDLRAPDDVPAELMPALQLLDDEAVVVGVGHRTAPHQLRRTLDRTAAPAPRRARGLPPGGCGRAGCAPSITPEIERLRRVAVPGGLDRAVHGFEGLHGGEQQALAALLVLLGELGFEPVAEGLVVGLERVRRGRDLRDAIFGQARRLAERLERVRRGRRTGAARPSRGRRWTRPQRPSSRNSAGRWTGGLRWRGSRAVYRRVTGLRR